MGMQKTQMLLLSRKRRAQELEHVKIEMNGMKIERSKCVKCLGMWLDEDLEQVQSMRKRCFAGLAKLGRLKDVLPSDIKKKVCNALVLPHLDYCSVVWQECTKDLKMKIERVQNYGMHIILSQPPRTPSKRSRDKLNG